VFLLRVRQQKQRLLRTLYRARVFDLLRRGRVKSLIEIRVGTRKKKGKKKDYVLRSEFDWEIWSSLVHIGGAGLDHGRGRSCLGNGWWHRRLCMVGAQRSKQCRLAVQGVCAQAGFRELAVVGSCTVYWRSVGDWATGAGSVWSWLPVRAWTVWPATAMRRLAGCWVLWLKTKCYRRLHASSWWRRRWKVVVGFGV